jgi:hypothetical protein
MNFERRTSNNLKLMDRLFHSHFSEQSLRAAELGQGPEDEAHVHADGAAVGLVPGEVIDRRLVDAVEVQADELAGGVENREVPRGPW